MIAFVNNPNDLTLGYKINGTDSLCTYHYDIYNKNSEFIKLSNNALWMYGCLVKTPNGIDYKLFPKEIQKAIKKRKKFIYKTKDPFINFGSIYNNGGIGVLN